MSLVSPILGERFASIPQEESAVVSPADEDEGCPVQWPLPVGNHPELGRSQRISRRHPIPNSGVDIGHQAAGRPIIDFPERAKHTAATGRQEGAGQSSHPFGLVQGALAGIAGRQDDEVGI